MNAEYYVGRLLPELIADCKRLLPARFMFQQDSLSSATSHSRLKTELFKISYPGSTPAPRHIRHHHLLQP